MRIGVDAGGTFTDFVVLDDEGRLDSFKIRSNPRGPHEVILAGLERAAGRRRTRVIHGSTVATNALLERKGARTAFLTTAGFEDLLEIGRQNRARLYDLTPPPRRLLVDSTLCFGVDERSHADGSVERRPKAAQLRKLRSLLRKAGVRSVAVCLLHSYRNPENEQAVEEALRGAGFYLSVSHAICPEFREYERASTTTLNAYVGPLMQDYLSRLAGARHDISVMQSNGGSITLEEAGRQAVRTVLSGPAGGVVGALVTSRESGFNRVLGFDMGGTSTDVSLCDGAPRETVEAYVDGFPVRVPMLEIHTVGAGGGSLARVDSGGLLRVGPESAGAEPGPACYGKGEEPAVTDAHVVLGRIGEEQFLGGAMKIDAARARAAVDRVARQLGLKETDAAAGILRVANATMDRAIRVVSVERGYDPRDFALLAFGGCGGLHACELAEGLGISVVLVPKLAGALSALGMLLAGEVRDYAAGALGRSDFDVIFRTLENRAKRDLRGSALERYADLRYRGQSYELTVPWTSGLPAAQFHDLHEKTYGYALREREIEVVTLRVRARRAAPPVDLRDSAPRSRGRSATRRLYTGGRWYEAAAWKREQLNARGCAGPALVLDYGSTTLVPPGWRAGRDRTGMLVLRRNPA